MKTYICFFGLLLLLSVFSAANILTPRETLVCANIHEEYYHGGRFLRILPGDRLPYLSWLNFKGKSIQVKNGCTLTVANRYYGVFNYHRSEDAILVRMQ